MKTTLLLLAGLLIAAAPQAPVTFARTYKVGEVDKYKLDLDVQGIVHYQMQAEIVRTVKKTYDDGSADIETTVQDVHAKVNGEDQPSQGLAPQPATRKFDKSGAPIGGDPNPNGLDFMRFAAILPAKPIGEGGKEPVSVVDPDHPTSAIVGNITLDSVKDGKANLSADLTVSDGSHQQPMKVKSKSIVDIASGKLDTIDGTLDTIPGLESLQIKSAKFTITREQS